MNRSGVLALVSLVAGCSSTVVSPHVDGTHDGAGGDGGHGSQGGGASHGGGISDGGGGSACSDRCACDPDSCRIQGRRLDVGDRGACVIRGDGALWCWGVPPGGWEGLPPARADASNDWVE